MEKVGTVLRGLFDLYDLSDLFFFSTTLILILLIVYVVYLIGLDDTPSNQIEISKKDLEGIKKKQEKPKLKDIVDDPVIKEELTEESKRTISEFEKKQEDTAIISYQELITKCSKNIIYEDDYESGFDDILIKKVDPTNTSNTQELVDLPKAIMMSYNSKKDFVKSLKKLNNNIVR